MSLPKAAGYITVLVYPVFVFLSVSVFRFPVRIVGLAVIVAAGSLLLMQKGRFSLSPLVMCVSAFFVILTNSERVLKFYPVAVNLVFLFTFALSLGNSETVIFRFARFGDKTIEWNSSRNFIRRYCRRVTYVWCF